VALHAYIIAKLSTFDLQNFTNIGAGKINILGQWWFSSKSNWDFEISCT